jgi:hypothetical protein
MGTECKEFFVDPIWLALFLVTVLDYFIGKTKKTQSNSIIELVIKFLLRRKL